MIRSVVLKRCRVGGVKFNRRWMKVAAARANYVKATPVLDQGGRRIGEAIEFFVSRWPRRAVLECEMFMYDPADEGSARSQYMSVDVWSDPPTIVAVRVLGDERPVWETDEDPEHAGYGAAPDTDAIRVRWHEDDE